MLTAEQLTELKHKAIIVAQTMLADMSAKGLLAFSQPLCCRIMWPQQHKGEHYLMLGLSPEQTICVAGLSESARNRVNEYKERLAPWSELQEWHLQCTFYLAVMVRVVQEVPAVAQSGLVLAH